MAKQQLHVAVVGAGLGGLAAAIGISRAGHLVTVFEQAAVLCEIGAGIQIPPNSSRILRRWGLLPEIESISLRPVNVILRSYRDGKPLNRLNLAPGVEDTYGAPFLEIHRAEFHRILVEESQRLGVKIRLGSKVEKIDFENTSLQIKDGGKFNADIILGADGLKSTCREALLGRPDPPQLTGNLAYRFIVKGEDMMQYPDLKELALVPTLTCWAGPDSHAVGYPLKGGLYNVVLVAPDNLPEMVNTAKADIQEMLDFFQDWDPRLRALLSIVQETFKWRLLNSQEMKTWSHPSGTFALLGDACHATLPNLAQGAAIALEDGAVLGFLFEKLQTRNQLKDILVIYERIRKPRTTRIVKESTEYRDIFHMRDGPRQRERDRQLLEEPPFDGYPGRFSDPELQRFMLGYDAHAEVERAWETYLRGHFPGTEGAFRESLQGGLTLYSVKLEKSKVANGTAHTTNGYH